jgi:hypothetical protein
VLNRANLKKIAVNSLTTVNCHASDRLAAMRADSRGPCVVI